MLKWTKEQPTEEGWYWKKDNKKESYIVYVRKHDGAMCIMDWAIPISGVEWAGPIETE